MFGRTSVALRQGLLRNSYILNSRIPGFGKFGKNLKEFGESAKSKTKEAPNSGRGNQKNGPSRKPNGNKKDDESNNQALMITGAGLAALFLYSFTQGPEGKEVDWQTFKSNLLAAGEVERLVVVNKQICRVYLKRPSYGSNMSSSSTSGSSSSYDNGGFSSDPYAENSQQRSYSKVVPTGPANTVAPYYFNIGSLENFERRLEQAQRELNIGSEDFVPVQYHSEANYLPQMLQLAPTLLFVGWLMYAMRGGAGGGAPGGPMSQVFKIGKSPAKKLGKEESNVRFTDVAGCEEAKQEIVEFVDFLKNPKRFSDLGAKIPKGALLYGPPGTGKTLLAKAVAGEASVPFFSISGSDFLEMFVGVGPSRVRDLFSTARSEAPCIIFIDEIDAVARARNRGGFGGNDERENTLNQLLVELDGFNTKEGVVVMGATNRLDILDKAILRPGRFDRQVKVDLPDIQGRKAMFDVHLKNVKVEGDANDLAQRMAALTPGFSGAQIANVVNEAAILAARDSNTLVKDNNFEKAIDRVIGGLERTNHIMSQQEKKTVAYHEAGHAIIGWFLEHTDPLLKVTIIPRTSGALGFAQYLPKEVSLQSQQQIEDRMCMALGGRAAEELTFGVVTTGARDDLDKVTKMAYAMVTTFGMSDKIGQLSFPSSNETGEQQFTKPYSEVTAQTIDDEVRRIVDNAFDRARDLLREHSSDLEKVALRLLEKETITQHDIAELVGERKFKSDETHSEFVAAGKSLSQKAAEAAANIAGSPAEPSPAPGL